ncbi:MAG: hypothetical protein GX775_04460 [Erysipelothrix sp.]|nr:hypothetical protein [Erysipelothrix sp.]
MKVSGDEKIVFDFLSSRGLVQRGQIDEAIGFHKAKTIRILNKLIQKELVKKERAVPSTLYSINE